MKTTLSEQSYQWQNDDGSYGVGKLVMCGPDGNSWVTEELGTLGDKPRRHMRVQVAESYTRELVFIEFGKLSVYPQHRQSNNQKSTKQKRGT